MMIYSPYTWNLVGTLEPASPASSCKAPATFIDSIWPHSLIPSAQTINQKKAKNPDMRFNSQQIVSHCLGLCTQNAGLRQVDLEPSPKGGSDMIKMPK